MQICYGCMEKLAGEKICPHCGYKEGTEPSTPMHLKPGTILSGKYLLGRVLGYGGFGITYLAMDINLEIKLAIKEYMPQDMATRSGDTTTVSVYSGDKTEAFNYGLDKFMEEAKTLGKFDDVAEIVAAKDFFKENGTAYLVMSYIDGMTLKDYAMNNGGKLGISDTLSFILPVMKALEKVHAQGILHRDISPDNIYITKNYNVKLLDFGAARYSIGERSKSLSVLLKPGYAPAEQYRSKGKQGPWTDVYALAATMYKLITGITPPDALDRMEEDALQSPEELGIDIPENIWEAITKAMSVREGNRYQAIDEFYNELVNSKDEKKKFTNNNADADADNGDKINNLKKIPLYNRLNKIQIGIISSVLVVVIILVIVAINSNHGASTTEGSSSSSSTLASSDKTISKSLNDIINSDSTSSSSGNTGVSSASGNNASGQEQTSGNSATTSETGTNTNYGDLVTKTIYNYEYSIVNAINKGDFSIVEPYLYYNSSLYKSQNGLVTSLYSKGTTEELLSYEIKSAAMKGNLFKIITHERFRINKKDKEPVVMEFDWVYNGILSDGKLQLTDIARPSLADSPGENSNTNTTSNNAGIGRWPWTSKRLATTEDLQNLSKSDLKIMRNEIYARHGWIFSDSGLSKYFASQAWYIPGGPNDEKESVNKIISNELNSFEKINGKFILDYEKRMQ